MYNERVAFVVAWVIMAIAALFVAHVAANSTSKPNPRRVVPQCAEDQVLVGTGDFEDGRWQAYWCGPAVDDYRGGR